MSYVKGVSGETGTRQSSLRGFLPRAVKDLFEMERENWNAQILDIWLDSHTVVHTIWIELPVARSSNTSS